MIDEAARFTAEQTVMDANIEVRELKHLLIVAEDKITKLEAENAEMKKTIKYEAPNSVRDAYLYSSKQKEDEGTRRGRETAEYLKSQGYMGGKKDKDAPLRSVMSEKYAEPEDKSQLNADDEEPNKESF